ncbi:MAG: response regulator [Chloroflexota bacterium]|nr:response regulator [Chloroflexota bacterium]
MLGEDGDSIGESAYHVLVVDGDPSALEVATRALEPLEGVEVATASDGFEAGLQMVAFAPDLLVLDLMLHDVDGFELCRRIRRDPDLADIKILVVTAHGTHENLERVLAAGADDFIHKPIDAERLRQRVHALLDVEK